MLLTLLLTAVHCTEHPFLAEFQVLSTENSPKQVIIRIKKVL